MEKKTSAAQDEESAFWADRVADELIKRNKKVYVCEGMWTPSGSFHIGNARPEIFVPYSVKRVLEDRGLKAVQNLIIDDFDGVRKIPLDLGVQKKDEPKYLGKPCALAPSPVPGYKSWADCFASPVKSILPAFGVDLDIKSVYHEYKSGLFNRIIVQTLDNHTKIVDIWNRISGAEKTDDFLPIQMLCKKCGSILSTTAKQWDGKEVTYTCACGHSESAQPTNGNAKLHWRVHWVANWMVHNVDFESGGKDHFSKGGSVDMGNALMREVFGMQPPLQIPTEFINLRGAKMSGSVGNVITLDDWLKIAPPDVFRFMNFMYRPGKAIDFDLTGNSLPLLFDRFERAEQIFYGKENAETEKMDAKLKLAYKLSKTGGIPKQMPYQLPFSLAVRNAQIANPNTNPDQAIQKISSLKGKVPESCVNEVLSKLRNARAWVEQYAPAEFKIGLVEKPPKQLVHLRPEVKLAISAVASELANLGETSDDSIQHAVLSVAEKNNIPKPELFKAVYLALTGKDRGPKVGTLILELGIDACAARLFEVGGS